METPIKPKQSFDGCHIFCDSNNDFVKMYFAKETMTGMSMPQKPGVSLIEFCEMDFSDLENFLYDIEAHRFFNYYDTFDDDFMNFLNLCLEKIEKYEEKYYPVHIFTAKAFNKIARIEEGKTYEYLLKKVKSFLKEINSILYKCFL